jgi:hypothetical protein
MTSVTVRRNGQLERTASSFNADKSGIVRVRRQTRIQPSACKRPRLLETNSRTVPSREASSSLFSV